MNQNTNVNVVPSYGQRGDLHFSQYDVGRTATINLYAVNEAYTIPVGATVKIQATKPSGLGFDVACTFSGSVVTVVSTETMTEESGRFPCELKIIDGDDVIGTANFMFCVEKSPHPDGTVDGDSEEIISEIEALVLQSEGWAVGTQNGVPVSSDSPYYENNSKWWAEHPAGGGITQAVKVALLNCFSHVAWIDENGQTYYDALEDALYDVPAPTLTSISAVYTQSGTVYDTDSLDSLKSDLVVTATYSDSSTATVPSADYTLSGTLTAGTSTITVTYEGLTATFNVTVTNDLPSQYTWLYEAKDGELLSEQDYVTKTTSGGDTSETLNDGVLIVHADNNGTTAGSTSVLLTYGFTDTTTSDAILTAKAKLVDCPVAFGTSGAAGQRFQLSNGSSGAQAFFIQNGSYITVVYFEGTTRKTIETNFLLNDYHIFELKLQNGHQVFSIDGTQIFDSATLSTNYCTLNRIMLQGVGTTITPNGATTNFKWIAYYEVS